MSRLGTTRGVPVDAVAVAAFTIQTDIPESDGTLAWDSTTLIVSEVEAGGVRGLGYSYGAAAAASLVRDVLGDVVTGRDPMNVAAAWGAMARAVRNVGRPGIASHAIAAVDTALWDLKAKLIDVPLATLIGQAQDEVPVYGSGGFTSYSDAQLQQQLAAWAESGIESVKMKVGRDPDRDRERVRLARDAIGGRPVCSSMPTAPAIASRRSRRPSVSPSTASPGSKSR